MNTSTRYTVVYEASARQWLSQQCEATQRHVAGALSSASFNPRAVSAHLYRQDIWIERTDGNEARRLKLMNPKPGVRAIFYLVDETRKMIIVKIAMRNENPYEDELPLSDKKVR